MASEINEDLCRLCSSNEGIKMNIFEPEKNFIAKINFVLSIVIAKHDLLPKMLCHKCVFKLEEYCEFRQMCLSTDKFFRSKLPWPDDSSQQGTLLQENELTNTKSTSSFKGVSSDGIVLNADYVNSRLGKTVATPLITDSSLLSQNNTNVRSTDKFILEVDDEGRTKIDGETQKSAQAITSVEDNLPRYSRNKESSQQVKRKQDKQGNEDNQKKNFISASHTATPLDKVMRSASDQKSLNPALPLSYVNPDESNPRLGLVSNAGTQPMDKSKESSGVNVGTESWTLKGSQTFGTCITGAINEDSPERVPPSSTSNTQNETVVEQKKSTQNNSLNNMIQNNNSALQQKTIFSIPLEREKDVSINQKVGSETQEVKFLVTNIPGACLIYTCETCERTFVSSESANAHQCGDDNISLSGEEVESQKGSSQQSFESETGNYLCNYCSKVFTRYVSLISHQEAHLQDLDDPSLESDDDDDDYVANRIHHGYNYDSSYSRKSPRIKSKKISKPKGRQRIRALSTSSDD
uniref:ZAD domain-containing protein n=1 Tax=Timema cristinae TaxID=61476 RepID=A0A7R9CW98_TIMCR|nr:unnamed protein product [Timema cristinae]